MILELFVLFIALACFLMWFGFYSKIRAFSVVGLSILFILSSWIILYSYNDKLVTGLEYKVGSNITNVDASTTSVQYQYTVYNDASTFWFGVLLAIVSGIGIILVAVYKEK